MDACRDFVYLRQWAKALKAASGIVQVHYVLGHMMGNPIKLFRDGDGWGGGSLTPGGNGGGGVVGGSGDVSANGPGNGNGSAIHPDDGGVGDGTGDGYGRMW